MLMFLLALMAAAGSYTAWARSDVAYFRFYDLANIHGSLKFYVPDRVAPRYIVPPDSVYQHWPKGAKYMQASFKLANVGGLDPFQFTAVTVAADSEYLLVRGEMPH